MAPLPDAPTESGRTKQVVAQIVVREENDGALYYEECYLPLHPDPPPERLYIFLHALRYTTSLGVFETEMPEWAAEGWEWERPFFLRMYTFQHISFRWHNSKQIASL